jgi:hypothetical protein
MLKIENTSITEQQPMLAINAPSEGEGGKSLSFTASLDPSGPPAVTYKWDFGDGTSEEGPAVTHSYTHPGEFNGKLSVESIEGVRTDKSFIVTVRGKVDTRFDPTQIQRPENPR